MGAPSGTKKAARRVKSETVVIQKAAALRRGRAMREEPICAGQDEIGEGALGHDGEDEENHQRAVHGDEGEVVFGLDGAVEGQREVGPGAVDAHQEREQGAGDYGDEGEEEIEAREGEGFGGEDAFHRARACSRPASHALNSSCETTRRRACMR